jgi:hypothetical protein
VAVLPRRKDLAPWGHHVRGRDLDRRPPAAHHGRLPGPRHQLARRRRVDAGAFNALGRTPSGHGIAGRGVALGLDHSGAERDAYRRRGPTPARRVRLRASAGEMPASPVVFGAVTHPSPRGVEVFVTSLGGEVHGLNIAAVATRGNAGDATPSRALRVAGSWEST